MIDNVGALPGNRDDSDQVDEWYSTSAVIDERRLALFASVEHSF